MKHAVIAVMKTSKKLISNFRRVLNAILCFMGNLRGSKLLVPTFQNILSVPSS